MAPERRPLHWPIAFPEVFAEGQRFDAVVANPPFIGGQKISGAAGDDYRNYCVAWMANGKKGSADLVAYFFLGAVKVAKSLGYLATNTIAQGDTSEVGLQQVIDQGWVIHRAVSSMKWPGDPTVEIAKLWIKHGEWSGRRTLDGRSAVAIDEMLYPASRSTWRKQPLVENSKRSFQGSIILGLGFTVPPEMARGLIARDIRNAEVLYPYLNGMDLNQSPTHSASRWVVNFGKWSEQQARSYPDCFAIVEEEVKPERESKRGDAYESARRYWWQHLAPRENLYRTIADLERVLVITRVSKTISPVFVSAQQVFSDATVVFAYDDWFHFGVLSSGFHFRWVIRYTSSLRTDQRYVPTDVFQPFPQPEFSGEVVEVAETFDEHRRQFMIADCIGLTTLYNRVHDPADRDRDIRELRDWHVELDRAVRDAYGWSDLHLNHGFHEVRGAGLRFTFAPETANEILVRLLELNRKRYLAEVSAGLHQRRGSGRRTARSTAARLLFSESAETP